MPLLFTDYKPLLVFFDASLNVTAHVIYEDSGLTTTPTDLNVLNGPYHLAQLSNGNIACYARGELMVTDATGNKVAHDTFNNGSDIQGLISLGDSFVISTDLYLKKFNANGGFD